jgi:hypothetical protein
MERVIDFWKRNGLKNSSTVVYQQWVRRFLLDRTQRGLSPIEHLTVEEVRLILATPVLADDARVTSSTTISQSQSLCEWQMHGSNVPGPEELAVQSMAALATARSASIAASQAVYQWDKGAAAERDAQLERLRELAKKWQTAE